MYLKPRDTPELNELLVPRLCSPRQVQAVSEFMFTARLNLFNTRREHEWRVIIGALVLLGAVDYAIIEHEAELSLFVVGVWQWLMTALFLIITWYQWGVQVRNRVDRLAMDELLMRMCYAIGIQENSCIRAGIDREHPNKYVTRRDIIFHYTYLWAFFAQIAVLAAACTISAFVPVYVYDLPSNRSAVLASAEPATRASGELAVGSSSFTDDALLDKKYSDYAADMSPALSWTAIPNAKSYALVVEDSDTKSDEATVHWVAWNIPYNVSGLSENVPKQTRLPNPAGMRQGKTSHGLIGYHGPVPPIGDAPHHYHFQIFALDTMLELPDKSGRPALLRAIRGHVLAKGTTVARYAQSAATEK